MYDQGADPAVRGWGAAFLEPSLPLGNRGPEQRRSGDRGRMGGLGSGGRNYLGGDLFRPWTMTRLERAPSASANWGGTRVVEMAATAPQHFRRQNANRP